MKKWRCIVCAYIHTGEEPPDRCPVCGSDKIFFEPMVEEEESVETASPLPADTDAAESPESPQEKAKPVRSFLIRQMLKHHAHPVSVHIPNGILPVSVFFIVISAFFQKPSTAVGMTGLEQAAFYNIIFVIISMPFVIFSGYAEWKHRYGGHLTRIFLIKMIAAGIVTLCAVSVVLWWRIDPDVTGPLSPHRWNFVLVNMVMLGAAALAGMIGGKLVFKE